MFPAALFHKSQDVEQPKCPATGGWIKKMIYKYKMEYYSAMKKKEILPFVATWMKLEGIMLSELSPTKKDKYCVISHVCGIYQS